MIRSPTVTSKTYPSGKLEGAATLTCDTPSTFMFFSLVSNRVSWRLRTVHSTFISNASFLCMMCGVLGMGVLAWIDAACCLVDTFELKFIFILLTALLCKFN